MQRTWLHCGSQPHVTPVPVDLMPSSDLMGTRHAHGVHISMHIKIHLRFFINSFFFKLKHNRHNSVAAFASAGFTPQLSKKAQCCWTLKISNETHEMTHKCIYEGQHCTQQKAKQKKATVCKGIAQIIRIETNLNKIQHCVIADPQQC